MSAFLKIYQQRNSIDDKFFRKIEEAKKNAEKEYKAALTIQAAFHRFVFKKFYADLNKKALLIQKAFRMHQARILVKCLRVEQEQIRQSKYFNVMALKIQRAWRKFVASGRVTVSKADVKNYTEQKIKIRKIIKRKKKRNTFFFG